MFGLGIPDLDDIKKKPGVVKADLRVVALQGNLGQAALDKERYPGQVFEAPTENWWRNLIQEDWKRTTGQVFDLDWKGSRLAFPWGVYEAKLAEDPSTKREAAIAAELALRMLHDLALVPGPPLEQRPYQTPTSDCFQVFAFTSEGPVWNIYVCWKIKKYIQGIFAVEY